MPLAEIYLIPALVLNVVTDIFILAIPAPVIFPVKTTVWRKISLIVIFSAGLFIMVAAILRVDFVLVQDDGTTAAIWSCREDFVAIIVGQAPIRKCLSPNKRATAHTGRHADHNKTSAARLHQEVLDRRDVPDLVGTANKVLVPDPELQRRL